MLDNKKFNFRGGFSLIELLVVIVLISILSVVAFVNFSDKSSKARDSMRLEAGSKVLTAFQIKSLEGGIDSNTCSNGTVSITYEGTGKNINVCSIALDGTDNTKDFLGKLGINGPVKDPAENRSIPYVFSYTLGNNTATFASKMELPASVALLDKVLPVSYASTHTGAEIALIKETGTYTPKYGINSIIPITETNDIYDIYQDASHSVTINSGVWSFTPSNPQELSCDFGFVVVGNQCVADNSGLTPTDESCFRFNPGTKTISTYDYLNPGSCPTDVIIPATIGGVDVLVIGEGAFVGITSPITSLVIPNSIITIQDMAFQNNRIQSIVIPNSVKTIGNSAFQYNQLSTISISSSVTAIGLNAFNGNGPGNDSNDIVGWTSGSNHNFVLVGLDWNMQ